MELINYAQMTMQAQFKTNSPVPLSKAPNPFKKTTKTQTANLELYAIFVVKTTLV